MGEWFDSHCHLHICEESSDLQELLRRARSAGVAGMLTLGTDIASSRRAIELCVHDGVRAAAGVHPSAADEWDEQAAGELEEMMQDPAVAAVGETGLDFFREHIAPELQHRAFRAHIALAKAHDKTLVIHTRASVEAALDDLDEVGWPERVIFHCWSGEQEALSRVVAGGAYVSFAGNISFKSSQHLRSLLPLVPRDCLLVETDSPYLTPAPHRGKPNEPANVSLVGEEVARVLDVPVAELAEITRANSRRALAL